MPECFDVVLVDAPCTAQSLCTKGKQGLLAFDAQQIAHSAARQARILKAAANLLKPGGQLIYSTCTFSFAENEAHILQMLERTDQWEACPSLALQRWASPAAPGCYRIWPHREGTAGGFAASIRRRAPAPSSMSTPPSSHRRQPKSLLSIARLPSELRGWGELDGVVTYACGHRLFAWPSSIDPTWLDHAEAGPELAFRKGTTLFPSYALARRQGDWRAARVCAVDRATACQYLSGKEIPAACAGWCVVEFANNPLGWIKGNGIRGKNHLPKPHRILSPH
jgi:NOL1/NOP2/fmu family ribosome biogenesis protein